MLKKLCLAIFRSIYCGTGCFTEKKLLVMQVHLHISWPGDLSVPADLLWAYCCWICKWSLPLLCILLVGRYMELDVVSYTSLHCLRLLADYLCWIARYMGVTCYLIYQYQLPSLGFFLLTTCSESVVRSSCWFIQGFRLGAETTSFFFLGYIIIWTWGAKKNWIESESAGLKLQLHSFEFYNV